MARYDPKPHEDPAYVTEWVSRRVTWCDHPHHRTGLVLNAISRLVDHRQQVLLRIARDDGFVAIGIDARQCSREETR